MRARKTGRAPNSRRVCADTGGTFTDVVELRRGRVRVHKVLSTPEAPEQAVLAGLARLGGAEAGGRLVHGTTVGLNAVLTGNGARVALVTNAGFEDLIEIGRQERPELYALAVGTRPTLVPRDLRFGIHERRLASGKLRNKATRDELRKLVTRLQRARVDAIAVCLLHSYAFPEDEARVARAFRSTGIPVTCSSHLLRRHREFERFSTTLMNAFIQPTVSQYLERLEQGAAPMQVHLLRNEGGSLPIGQARTEPVRTILSGPAGGAAAAGFWARLAGFDRAVGFDMGGTSADVALCADDTAVEDEARLGPHVLALPSVPLTSVGCGGGSLAFRDRGGALRVGPESAGADPGPACYGRGTQATVTDAHLVLGRLPARLLGGVFELQPDRARQAIAKLARALGLDVETTARGILDIADLQMARPLRAFTVGRGVDPADVCLVAFGGAGGLHAVRLASLVGFARVLVPPYPGVLSASGMLLARQVVETERASVVAADRAGLRRIAESARELANTIRADHPGATGVRVLAAMRYRGNNAEFWVDTKGNPSARFVEAFEQRFGFVQDLPIECLRLRGRATLEPSRERAVAKALCQGNANPSATVTPSTGATPFFDRAALSTNWRRGPFAITDYSGTTIVESGWRARREATGCIQIERALNTRA